MIRNVQRAPPVGRAQDPIGAPFGRRDAGPPSQPKDLGATHANRQPVAEVRSTQRIAKGFQRLCRSPARRLGFWGKPPQIM